MGNQQSIEGAAERRLKLMENTKKMEQTKGNNPSDEKSQTTDSPNGKDVTSDTPCMKDKIDNLIEGYLLNSECSDSDMDDLPSSLVEKFPRGVALRDKIISETDNNAKSPTDDIIMQCKKRRDTDNGSGSGDEKKEVNTDKDLSKNLEDASSRKTQEGKENDMNVTTYQSIIDKVMNSPTNNADADKKVETNSSDFVVTNTNADDSQRSENSQIDDKLKLNSNKDDMSMSKSKVMFLKDHIEKILDNSFKPCSAKQRKDNTDGDVPCGVRGLNNKDPLGPKKSLTLEEHMKNIVYSELLKEKISQDESDKMVGNQGNSDSTKFIKGPSDVVAKTGSGAKPGSSETPHDTGCKAPQESAPLQRKVRDESLRKSSVEAIMDNIIKNAVNEHFTPTEQTVDRKEEMRKSIRDMIYSESEPSPPRLEKYDVHDSSPKLLRADEHFAESHQQLLMEQSQTKHPHMAQNEHRSIKEIAYGYAGSGPRPAMSKGPYPPYSPQNRPAMPSPRQRHFAPVATYKNSAAQDAQFHHPRHIGALNQNTQKQAASFRDYSCVTNEQKLGPHSGHCNHSNRSQSSHSNSHMDSSKQRMMPHVANSHFPHDLHPMSHHGSKSSMQGQGRFPGSKHMDDIRRNPGVTMGMAYGPSPNLQYYQQSTFRMPQLYPTNPPIASPKESSAHVRTALPSSVHSGGAPHLSVTPTHHQDGMRGLSHSSKLSPVSPSSMRHVGQTVGHLPANNHQDLNSWPQKSRPEATQGRVPLQAGQPSPPVLDLTVKRLKSDLLTGESSNGEQPLDLTVKKPRMDDRGGTHYQNVYSVANFAPTNDKQSSLQNTHIHHLQNSMERYCHEARATSYPGQNFTRPPVRPGGMAMKPHAGPRPELPYGPSYAGGGQHLSGQGHLPSDARGHHTQHSPRGPAQYNAINNTPSKYSESPGRNQVPHMNNPQALVQQQPIKAQHLQQQASHFQQNAGQHSKQAHAQSESQGRQSADLERSLRHQESPESPSDNSGQRSRRSNSVSRHEPIQNIIGNHSPNDILYLICRLCGQTYGSPYGFRKHFRNQHGFEPHAQHTVVQTISATRTAMRGPPLCQPMEAQVTANMQYHPGVPPIGASDESRAHIMLPTRVSPSVQSPTQRHVEMTSSVELPRNVIEKDSRPSISNPDIKENSNDLENDIAPDTGDKSDGHTDRKYLECHECGQHFQLNDFGSYKRHCRQHGQPSLENQFKSGPEPEAQGFPVTQLVSNSADKVPPVPRISLDTEFKCKYCKELFLAPNQLEDHINLIHAEKPHKFQCLLCNNKRFHIFYQYKRHMSKKHRLRTPDISCPEIKFAEELSSGEKQADKEKEMDSESNFDLKFIPSSEVTRMRADTAVTSASPDSSSDPVTSSANKAESTSSTPENKPVLTINVLNKEPVSESRDSTTPGTETSVMISRQISNDSSSVSENSVNPDDNSDFSYMHKKFGSKRKLSTSQNSNDGFKSKYIKMASHENSRSPGMVQRSPSVHSNASCESELSLPSDSRSLTDSVGTKLSPLTVTGSEQEDDGKLLMKLRYGDSDDGEGMFNKGEARHQLPFVWDRITRSQAGKNIKPPKYH